MVKISDNGHVVVELYYLKMCPLFWRCVVIQWPLLLTLLCITVGHYSTVTMELKQNITSSELNLSQTEVPEAECNRTKEGWQRYIFQRIKSTFGYGAQLY